jgi:hypothetical protein
MAATDLSGSVVRQQKISALLQLFNYNNSNDHTIHNQEN